MVKCFIEKRKRHIYCTGLDSNGLHSTGLRDQDTIKGNCIPYSYINEKTVND